MEGLYISRNLFLVDMTIDKIMKTKLQLKLAPLGYFHITTLITPWMFQKPLNMMATQCGQMERFSFESKDRAFLTARRVGLT